MILRGRNEYFLPPFACRVEFNVKEKHVTVVRQINVTDYTNKSRNSDKTHEKLDDSPLILSTQRWMV